MAKIVITIEDQMIEETENKYSNSIRAEAQGLPERMSQCRTVAEIVGAHVMMNFIADHDLVSLLCVEHEFKYRRFRKKDN